MAGAKNQPWLTFLFGSGKGSDAGVMMLVLGLAGGIICIVFAKLLKKYHFVEA